MPDAILRAERIVRAFRQGSSLPALVQASDANSYIVKWRGAGDGPLGTAKDWIALHLAELFGIHVPPPVLLTLDDDLALTSSDAELRDLVRASKGLNLGLGFLDGAAAWQAEHSAGITQAYRDLVFLFDLLLLNVDRTAANPNMLLLGQQLYCIDFSASLSIRTMITGKSFDELPPLRLLRQHPFFTLQPCAFPNCDTSGRSLVNSAVQQIPDSWLQDFTDNVAETKASIVRSFDVLIADFQLILQKRLKLLSTLPLQSREEYLQQSKQNRQAFAAKFGSKAGPDSSNP